MVMKRGVGLLLRVVLLTATVLPFGTVTKGIVETLFAGNTKNVAVLELLRQWNAVYMLDLLKEDQENRNRP